MAKKNNVEQKNISWNGIAIDVPISWEARVIGSNHLHLESNFQPHLEIKWNHIPSKRSDELCKRALKKLEQATQQSLRQVPLPECYTHKLQSFTVQCFTTKKYSDPQYIFLHNEQHRLFLMLQFSMCKSGHPLQQIGKIECRAGDNPGYWSIQDVRFSLPSSFILQSHTMDPGFTTIHFKNDRSLLHLCRLAPAALRLQENTLQEILISLLGLENETRVMHESETAVQFERSPTLTRQILYRLRRKKPFILSKLWHDKVHDRLLGVFMEAVHPIDATLHETICSSYEISQT